MKGDFAMYENENKNMNGLGNENMEHGDVPETAVNWTIPGDGRSRQRQNTQSQNTEGQYRFPNCLYAFISCWWKPIDT